MAKVDPRTTDMWLRSRQITSTYQNKLELIQRTISRSLPGGTTKQVPLGLIADPDAGLCVDLNSYRTGVNVEMLYEMGIRVFDLRCFCPGRWEYGNWQYFQDTSFMDYYTRIRKFPDAIIGGYGVLNLFLDEESNYTSPIDPNVEMMKLYFKNAPCDYYTWDNEVGQIYKNGNPNTEITPNNHTKCLKNVMAQTKREMGITALGFPKIPEHYSAVWFLARYGGEAMKVYLDSIIGPDDVADLPFLPWLAWVPTVFSQSFAKPQDLVNLLITPNGIQENAYLHLRSEIMAIKWQCSWTLKGLWSPNVGIDFSILYGIAKQLSRYRYLHNLPSTNPPPPPDNTTYATKAEVQLIANRVTAVEAQSHPKSHTHPIGDAV